MIRTKQYFWVLLSLLIFSFAACTGQSAPKKPAKVQTPQKEQKGNDKTGKTDGQVSITEMTKIPIESPEDKKYANVFKPLDGTWRGEFKIYVHESGQTDAGRPKTLKPEEWTKPPYKLQSFLKV